MAGTHSTERHITREKGTVSDDIYNGERLGALSVAGVQAVANTARIKGDAEKLAEIVAFAEQQAAKWSTIGSFASETLLNMNNIEGSENGNKNS
jgi:hypothetical protein